MLHLASDLLVVVMPADLLDKELVHLALLRALMRAARTPFTSVFELACFCRMHLHPFLDVNMVR